jgi:hypothetical protein
MSTMSAGASAFDHAARAGIPASHACKRFGSISHHCFMRIAIEHRIGFWRLPNGRLLYSTADVERIAALLAEQLPVPR